MDMAQTQRPRPRPKLSDKNRGTIEIDNDVKERLRAIGKKSESFSDIIRRLISYN